MFGEISHAFLTDTIYNETMAISAEKIVSFGENSDVLDRRVNLRRLISLIEQKPNVTFVLFTRNPVLLYRSVRDMLLRINLLNLWIVYKVSCDAAIGDGFDDQLTYFNSLPAGKLGIVFYNFDIYRPIPGTDWFGYTEEAPFVNTPTCFIDRWVRECAMASVPCFIDRVRGSQNSITYPRVYPDGRMKAN